MKVSKAEVLAHAQELKKLKPDITSDELGAALRDKFIESNTPRLGLVSNPMDWIGGLRLIFNGLDRVLNRDDQQGIEDIIEGVIKILE